MRADRLALAVVLLGQLLTSSGDVAAVGAGLGGAGGSSADIAVEDPVSLVGNTGCVP